MRIRHLLLAASLLAATPALAGPTEDFHALEDSYWATILKDSPTFSTSVGVKTYDAQLDVISRAEVARQAAEARAFLTRLDAIPAASLSASDQANRAILRTQLANSVAGAQFGSQYMFYAAGGSFPDNFADQFANFPLRDAADYDNYLARLALAGDRINAATELSVDAAKKGWARPCSTLATLDTAMAGGPDADPAKSRFYEVFAHAPPAGIGSARWQAMQERARSIIAKSVNPAIARFDAAYRSDLRPRCLKSDSIAALPDGKAYYAYLVRYHTTTDMTPAQIHALGMSEVTRIRGEMDKLARKAGFASRAAMIADMRTNPRWFAHSGDELMADASRMAKTLDGKMPTLFGKLPRLPYGVREVPAATAAGTTTAYYMPGSPDAGVAGTYYVNTSKLDQRPLWELPALTSHEAVPGHHNQIALQQELDFPAWRRNTAFFTAFVEGWGLYSEHLGIELGIYDTPQKDMGRLSYEMWRACRLVVDTGIHAEGWPKARAVAFMKENTALTDANIDAEVNRYISTPGQALAYKIGEMKLRALRARAEQALGSRFDVRRFHDAVLSQGAVPLDVLDAQINAWIAAEKARA